MNELIRNKYMNYRRSNFTWRSNLSSVLFNSAFLFLLILKDESLKGVIVYSFITILEFILANRLHLLIYSNELEYEYQWGNEDFELFEKKYMDKLYSKGELDEEEYDDYFYEYDRDTCEEFILECKEYFRKESICSFILLIIYFVIASLISCKVLFY